MRWLYWSILAYIVLVLQAGVGPFIAWGGVPPNLVLILVVFFALNAPREPALLAGFVLGLMQDLLTTTPLGFNAFIGGLVALLVQFTQASVYRDHPLTHFMLTLGAGVLASLFTVAHGWFYPASPPLAMLITCNLYTAVLAPLLLWPLGRLKPLFAFQARRLK